MARVGRASSDCVVLALSVAVGCHGAPQTPPGFQGIVEYDEHTVSFEEPGRIAGVLVQRGAVLRSGDLLAKLDDTLERATRDARAAELRASRADLALLQAGTRREDVAAAAADVNAAAASESLLQTSAARARRLFGDGAVPQAEVDRADSDLEQATARRRSLEQRLAALRRGSRPEEIARAEAMVQQSESALELEDERLARYLLHAPQPGFVLDVEAKAGELAGVGTPAVTLADTGHPYVDVFVPEGDLAGIRIGARATVRVDATSEPFEAVIEYVSPETEFTPKFLFSERERPNLVVRIRVRVEDPAHRLHAGVPAFARVER
jgi:HlyD family secretion protein